jgi:hypothetical protein
MLPAIQTQSYDLHGSRLRSSLDWRSAIASLAGQAEAGSSWLIENSLDFCGIIPSENYFPIGISGLSDSVGFLRGSSWFPPGLQFPPAFHYKSPELKIT